MRTRCHSCGVQYKVADEHGGRWARCAKCKHRFLLPIADARQLLAFASSAPWHQLKEFITHRGARGHSRDVIDQLVRIYERRRWDEEWRLRRESPRTNERTMSKRERKWQRVESRIQRLAKLETLRSTSPSEFEQLVADLFTAQGYIARAIGGTADWGIDVDVCLRNLALSSHENKRGDRGSGDTSGSVCESS